MTTLNTKYDLENEQITLGYEGKIAVVSYREFSEILKNVYQGSDSKKYMESRKLILIEYMNNLDKPKNEQSKFSW
jgi:hypothetical protein